MFKQSLWMFLLGLLFGVGLLVSGMANPQNVLAFLDITGNWRPELMFVMIGAIGVAFFFFRVAKRCSVSVLGLAIQLPTSQEITPQLLMGSMLFGMGWGLVGLCPGPALVLLGQLNSHALIFVLSMLAGMGLVDRVLLRGH